MGIPILGPACTAGPPRRRTEAGGANLAPVCQEQWAALLRRHSLQDIETVTKFPLAEAEVGQLATSDSSFGLLDAVVQKSDSSHTRCLGLDHITQLTGFLRHTGHRVAGLSNKQEGESG